MEPYYGKLISAISMFLTTFVLSMLPLILAHVGRAERSAERNFPILSFLSCFGGGVFMGTCLLHLVPDVQKQMGLVYQTLGINSTFPMAEFLLGFGFLIVLAAEQIAHYFKGLGSIQDPYTEPYQNYSAINQSMPYSESSHPSQINAYRQPDIDSNPGSSTKASTNHDQDLHSDLHSSILSHQHFHGDSRENYGTINQSVPYCDNSGYSVHPDGQEDQPGDYHALPEVLIYQNQSSDSILRSLLLLFALSLHSVFEGLAIGLQKTTDSVFHLLFVVLIHKSIIAFTLGLDHVKSQLSVNKIVQANGFFSLASPVGIVIGIIVVDYVSGVPMIVTSGVLQGLAAGTFLYVTFFEILPEELKNSENRLVKLGCIIVGFSVICVMLLVLPDND